ncbi:hypothetical protein BURK1_01951 [Burkholderiales bacterium]|nr:hypothetical protein BURK1_01951 [Burkholderiales bacterium]
MNRTTIDRDGGFQASTARALVATAFVMGLAALVWVHVDLEVGTVPIVERALAPAAGCAGNDCLHAPAGDPSVPAADGVLDPRASSTLDAPPVPTF